MRLGPFTFASDFFYSKTTWAAFGAVAAAIGGAMNHEVTWSVALLSIFGILTGLFHRDNNQKATEANLHHQAWTKVVATAKPPAVNYDDLFRTHAAINKDAVVHAVAATVTAILDRYAAEYAEETEPRKPVQMTEDGKPVLTVVEGGTGVDSGATAATVASLDEPEDGEADAE